jgi:hypothetical protein
MQPGSPMVVTMIDGGRREGTFRSLGPNDLVMTDSAGQDVDVARSNIRRIVARGKRDGLMNGALIGAGTGAGIAASILAIAASKDGYILASAKWGAPLLLSAGGTVIGVLVDRGHTKDRVIYVRR